MFEDEFPIRVTHDLSRPDLKVVVNSSFMSYTVKTDSVLISNNVKDLILFLTVSEPSLIINYKHYKGS